MSNDVMGEAVHGAVDRLLVTVVEAARVLAVGRTTVYALINAGELRVVHIGRAVRVPVEELRRYVLAAA